MTWATVNYMSSSICLCQCRLVRNSSRVVVQVCVSDWPWTSSSAPPASAAGRTSALLWWSLSSHHPQPEKIYGDTVKRNPQIKAYIHTPRRKTDIYTHLVKEVVDSKLVVIEQNLLFCGEEPLAQGEAGSWDGWGIVLYIQFVGELVGGKLTHWRRKKERKKGEREGRTKRVILFLFG